MLSRTSLCALVLAAAVAAVPTMSRSENRSVVASVEGRISELHETLRITSAQEPKWNAVARVMRDDARIIEALAQHRQRDLANMTAIENLQSFQRLAAAHADGLSKLGVAFEALYADMTDAQKKHADAAFRYEGGRGAAGRPGR